MKYEYSPLERLTVQNFMNIGTVALDFTHSPIVCLKGGNEAGKSAIVMALLTLGTNLNSKQYKEYIRLGSDGWTTLMETADGKAVYRRKTPSSQSFGVYITSNGEKHLIWSIDKLDENQVPEGVQNIIGFVVEPETKELLQVRTYRDQMLFVETTGGSNYKVMYNALNVDSISRGVKYGTQELRELKQQVDSYEASSATCKEQLRKIRIVDTQALEKIQSRVKSELKVVKALKEALDIKHNLDMFISQQGILSEVKNLTEVDEYYVATLEEAHRTVLALVQMKKENDLYMQLKDLTVVDLRVFDKFDDSVKIKNSLANLKAVSLAEVQNCALVDVGLAEKLLGAREKLAEVRELSARSAIYKSLPGSVSEDVMVALESANEKKTQILSDVVVYTELKQKVDSFYAELKNMGLNYKICPNCNELVFTELGEHVVA